MNLHEWLENELDEIRKEHRRNLIYMLINGAAIGFGIASVIFMK